MKCRLRITVISSEARQSPPHQDCFGRLELSLAMTEGGRRCERSECEAWQSPQLNPNF